MWCFRPLLLLLAYGVSTAFHNSFKPVYKHADAGRLDRSFRLGDSPFDPKKSSIVPVNEADMKYVAYLLANLTEHLDTSPEKALTLASQNMGWLYSRDIPGFVQISTKVNLLKRIVTFVAIGLLRSYWTTILPFVKMVE